MGIYKKIIDDCDYYLLIIAGRYGSLSEDGISYTEKEFDYAITKNIKVIVFIHKNPSQLSYEKSEMDETSREKLEKFKSKVQTGRMVKFWSDPKELSDLISLSLNKTIKMYPAKGWVRADKIANEEILSEINTLRKENDILKKEISELTQKDIPIIENIADIDESYKIITKTLYGRLEFDLTWQEIFNMIAPYLIRKPYTHILKLEMESILLEKQNNTYDEILIDKQCFDTIIIQLEAYKLITNEFKSVELTQKGKNFMFENRTIKKEIL